MKKSLPLIILGLCLFGSSSLFGDVVHLKDGRKLRGFVLRQGDKVIVIQKEGRKVLRKDQVRAITAEGEKPEETKKKAEEAAVLKKSRDASVIRAEKETERTRRAEMLKRASDLILLGRRQRGLGQYAKAYWTFREAQDLARGTDVGAKAEEEVRQTLASEYERLGLVNKGDQWLTREEYFGSQGKVRYLSKWVDGASHRQWLDRHDDFEKRVTSKYFTIWTDCPHKGGSLLRWLSLRMERIYQEYERIYGIGKRTIPGKIYVTGKRGKGRFQPRVVEPFKEVVLVELCRDRDSYLRRGGTLGTGGYTLVHSRHLKSVKLFFEDVRERESIMQTFIHELGHVFFTHFIKKGPLWADEGLAEYFANSRFQNFDYQKINFRDDDEVKVAEALLQREKKGLLKKLLYLEEEEEDFCYPQYALAWSFVHFLMNKHKSEFTKYLQLLQHGRPVPIENLISGGMDRLERQWRRHTKKLARSVYKETLQKYPPGIGISRNARRGLEMLYRVPLDETYRAYYLQNLMLFSTRDRDALPTAMKLLGTGLISFRFSATFEEKGVIAAHDAWRRLARQSEAEGKKWEARKMYKKMLDLYGRMGLLGAAKYASSRLKVLKGPR
jgi:hypothetical protein